MTYVERLAAITNADEQMEQVETIAEELLTEDGARTPEIAAAILALYERSPNADGFGTFATLNMVLEEVDPKVLEPLVRASIARQPTWMTRELLAIFE